MVSSLAFLSSAHIRKYIDTHLGKDSKIVTKIKNSGKYYPIFFLNSTFRIMSATMTVLFFRSFSLIIFLIYSSTLKMVINLYARSKKVVPQKELRRQMVESVCLSFVTNTNLESTAIAKLCRSVTFYFNLIFHILHISLIFLMSQFMQEDEYEYVPFWVNFPLVKEHNWAMPALVLSVILAGIFSLLLDLVFFYCCKSGVYNFSKLKIGGETKDLQLKCIKTTTISHSKYIVNKYR